MNVLKVTKVEAPKSSSNGNGSYKTITVQEFRFAAIGNKTVEIATVKQATRNLWSERQRKDGSGVVKGDTFYDTISQGDYVAGEIVNYNTSPYDIDGKTVTSRKTLVFEGENGISICNSELSSNNACVIDENGMLTKDLKTSNLVPQA